MILELGGAFEAFRDLVKAKGRFDPFVFTNKVSAMENLLAGAPKFPQSTALCLQKDIAIMTIESIPVKSIWSSVCKILPWLVRWRYSGEKLSKLVYVDLRPRHDSTEVNLGPVASFSLWLRVINLTPFPIELDRANFSLWCGGVTLGSSILKKQSFAPGEIKDLYLKGAIPDGYADQIAKNAENKDAGLDGNIEFNSKVRSFAKAVGYLEGIKPRYLNTHLRNIA